MIEIYEYENDIRDFKIPYKLYGKVDEEIMVDKYKKLKNVSPNPLIVRLSLSKIGY